MKNVFIGLTSRLNMAEERISKFEVISIETTKIEKQRERRMKSKKKKQNRISMNCESSTKDMTYTEMGIYKEEEIEKREEYMKT